MTYNNPVLIADRDGTVHMLFCLEYMRCFYQRSTDDGVTWSTPVEITRDVREVPAGLRLEGARDRARITASSSRPAGSSCPCGSPPAPAAMRIGLRSPRRSTATTRARPGRRARSPCPAPTSGSIPNETVAIELADGRVMLNVRSESKAHRRLVTTSKDGATGWSTPKFDDALLEPICMGGIVRYSLAKDGGKNRILFSNPDNLARADGKEEPGKNRDRKNVSVKLSYDEGQTWAVNKPVEPGYSVTATSR